jgi:hypothetical protein
MLHGDPSGLSGVGSCRGAPRLRSASDQRPPGRLGRRKVQGSLNEVAILGAEAGDPATPMHFAA